MSRGRVQTRPFRATESTPQLGHADAVSSAVTTCTTRPPNASDATRSTARPPRSSRREASDTRSFCTWRIRVRCNKPVASFDQKLSLTTAMITRSRASYVSALDPSCPAKSEEPGSRGDRLFVYYNDDDTLTALPVHHSAGLNCLPSVPCLHRAAPCSVEGVDRTPGGAERPFTDRITLHAPLFDRLHPFSPPASRRTPR